MKKITEESRKTLMMYAKTSNVLEQFAKELRGTVTLNEDDLSSEGSNDD